MDHDDEQQFTLMLSYQFNDLNFKEVLEILTNILDSSERATVLRVDLSDPAISQAIDKIKEVINTTVQELNVAGNFPDNMLKMGNMMLNEIIKRFNRESGIIAKGFSSNAGYPRGEISINGIKFYLSPKTSNLNRSGNLRYFYLSPGERISTLRGDAYHLSAFFDIADDFSQINSWKLLDLADLSLNIKFEFNASRDDLLRLNQL
ncbi:hypothetical protein [Candidatus Harpocratesius sp.]